MTKETRNPADYIVPLSIGGLEGRMLHIPASPPAPDKAAAGAPENVADDAAKEPRTNSKTDQETLFVYGHHSTLERWWGLMEVFSEFGAVTMPDLPGFGGMDSFYKVGQKPSIDAMADYLAAFIKWRYKRRKVAIVGMSFGFVVVTRMLQRYPELIKKITILVSLAGFAHYDDFIIPKRQYNLYLTAAKIFQHRIPAFLFKNVGLNPLILRFVYGHSNNAKFKDTAPERFKEQVDVEVHLWRVNDVRTAMYTSAEFFRLDNCKQQIDMPVYHIGVVGDHYFDNNMVEQHYRIIFNDFQLLDILDLANHAPSVVATADEASAFVPEKLRQLLTNNGPMV